MSKKAEETRLVIREIVRRLYPEPVEVSVTVRFGAPQAAMADGTMFVSYDLCVPSDWLETVHARGLAAVGGQLVISAQPAVGPLPDGADRAWFAMILRPRERTGDTHTGRTPLRLSAAVEATYVVEYAGELAEDVVPQRAVARATAKFHHALGVPASASIGRVDGTLGSAFVEAVLSKGIFTVPGKKP